MGYKSRSCLGPCQNGCWMGVTWLTAFVDVESSNIQTSWSYFHFYFCVALFIFHINPMMLFSGPVMVAMLPLFERPASLEKSSEVIIGWKARTGSLTCTLTVQSDLPPSTLQPHILMTYHATYPNSPKGVKATCPSDLMGQKNVLKTYVYTYIYFPFPQNVWDLPMFWCRTCGSMVKPRGSGVWFHLNQWPCYNSSQISLQVHICEISIC